MPAPTISTAPPPPLRSESGATFATKAEAFVEWMAGAPDEFNALAEYLEGATGSAGPITSTALTMATARLLGRTTAAAGAVEEISVGPGLTLAGGTLSASGSTYTDEMAQDAVGTILTDSSTIDFTYNDGANTITAAVIASAVKPTESLIIACSDETTAITTGTAKVTFRMPYAFTLSAVRASVTTAPTGSTILIDINEGGTTILSTKLMIDASEKTSTTAATPAVISDTALADDAEITIDFDQVGSTIAGAGVKVYLIGSRT